MIYRIRQKKVFWEEDAHTETSCNQTLWQLVHRLTTDIVLSDNYPPMNKQEAHGPHRSPEKTVQIIIP